MLVSCWAQSYLGARPVSSISAAPWGRPRAEHGAGESKRPSVQQMLHDLPCTRDGGARGDNDTAREEVRHAEES